MSLNPSNFSAKPQRPTSPAQGIGCTPEATWHANMAQCSSTSPPQPRFHLQPAPSAWFMQQGASPSAQQRMPTFHLLPVELGGAGTGRQISPEQHCKPSHASVCKSPLTLSRQRMTFWEESTSHVRNLPTPNSAWASWGLTFLQGQLNCHD